MQDVARLLVHGALPRVVVAPHVLDRRVEHLMRLEAVDPEEERRVARVVAHPASRRCKDLRTRPVRLVAPVTRVVQVLQESALAVQRRIRRLRQGGFVCPEVVLEQVANQIPRSGAPTVAPGAADVLPRHESTGVVHVGLEEVRGVGDQPGGVALLEQDLGDGRELIRNLVPAVVPMLIRKPAHPREAAVANLQRWTGFGEAAVEAHRVGRERIQCGCGDTAELLARTHDVGPKRVDADNDDVQLVHGGRLPSKSRRPGSSDGSDHARPA